MGGFLVIYVDPNGGIRFDFSRVESDAKEKAKLSGESGCVKAFVVTANQYLFPQNVKEQS